MRYYEMVELPEGSVVAVGPFKDQDDASDFSEAITSFDSDLPIDSRGGLRVLSFAELAAEIGVKASALTSYRKA